MDPISSDDAAPHDLAIPRDPPRPRRDDIAAAVAKLAAAMRRQLAVVAPVADRPITSAIDDAAILAAVELAQQAEQLSVAEAAGWGDPTGMACRPPAGFRQALHALAASARHASVDVDSGSVLEVFYASSRVDSLAESLEGTGGQDRG